MQNRFKLFFFLRVAEDDLAHEFTLKAVGADHVRAEFKRNFRKGFTLSGSEDMRNFIGVNDRDAECTKGIRGCGFAAGDTAGQSDNKRHTFASFAVVKRRRTRAGPFLLFYPQI